MTDKQLLDALQNVDGKYTEEVEQYLSTRKIRPRAAKLFLPAAAAAACLGAVLFAAVPRNHDQVNVAESDITPQLMQDQSAAETEPPVTDMPAAVSEITQTAVQTAEPAVAAVSALTKAQVTTVRTAEATKPQPVSKAKPNVPAAAEKPAEADTEAAVPEPPAETTVTEALPETTAPEPPAPVYEMGDVDMDGQITFVDAALVNLDNHYQGAHAFPTEEWIPSLWDHAPLTPEQRQLKDVNHSGDIILAEVDGFLTESFGRKGSDCRIIYYVAMYRNWFNMDVTTEQYANDPDYYDLLAYEYKSTTDWGALQQEWNSSLGDAEQLYVKINSGGIGFNWRDDVEVPPGVLLNDFETAEEFYEYRQFKMTVEEFYEAAEVMKEKYFTNRWRSSE